jgi:hypothetical protein
LIAGRELDKGRSSIMKIVWSLLALIAPLAFGSDPEKPAKPDFTGVWQMDVLRTRFSGIPQPKSMVMHIEHHEPQIRVTLVTTTKAGEKREVLELATDGKFLPAPAHGESCTAAARWDQFNNTRLDLDFQCPKVSENRRMTLGSKGKILTTVMIANDANTEKNAYEFFFKQ